VDHYGDGTASPGGGMTTLDGETPDRLQNAIPDEFNHWLNTD